MLRQPNCHIFLSLYLSLIMYILLYCNPALYLPIYLCVWLSNLSIYLCIYVSCLLLHHIHFFLSSTLLPLCSSLPDTHFSFHSPFFPSPLLPSLSASLPFIHLPITSTSLPLPALSLPRSSPTLSSPSLRFLATRSLRLLPPAVYDRDVAAPGLRWYLVRCVSDRNLCLGLAAVRVSVGASAGVSGEGVFEAVCMCVRVCTCEG